MLWAGAFALVAIESFARSILFRKAGELGGRKFCVENGVLRLLYNSVCDLRLGRRHEQTEVVRSGKELCEGDGESSPCQE